MTEKEAAVLIIIAVIIGIAIHFIPTFIASAKSHPSTGAIFAVNLLLGWTLVGWLGALIWALSNPDRPQKVYIKNNNHDVADEIRKLGELKNDGILTTQEFETKKRELLSKI